MFCSTNTRSSLSSRCRSPLRSSFKCPPLGRPSLIKLVLVNNTAMLVPNTNTRARCTGDDESAPKTRDSARRRCTPALTYLRSSADVSVPRQRTHDDRTGRVFPDHLITYEIRRRRFLRDSRRASVRSSACAESAQGGRLSTPLVGCSLGRSMRSSVLYLVFNFGASVLIIFVNKSLFSGGLRFESACTLNSG